MEIKNICCIGAGYVGGPTMAVIALKCPHINVTVVDANPDKIKAWNGPLDELPVYEPGLSDIIKKTRGRNLFFSEDIKGSIQKSEMIFMAVNTPTRTEGEGAGMGADLKYIELCAKDIARFSKSDKIVIEKSTVPIRTAEKIKEILDENKGDIHFDILSNPEFLAEGTAVEDMINPDRVLIGGHESESGQKATQTLVKIYENWVVKEKILTTNVWSSELAKLASNAMLAQRISSINSLSALCEKTGANIDELSKAIGMDHRIGPHFLKTSVGFGGSCFQKDILNLVYLCKHYGLEKVAEYWHQVVKINDYQKSRFVTRIINKSSGEIKNKNITILGWAFKKDTNDSRESAAIDIVLQLINNGAKVSIYDPKVRKNQIISDLSENFIYENFTVYQDPFEAIKDSNSIAIVTEWDQFKSLPGDKYINYVKQPANIFDGRNLLDKEALENLGYNFYSIGK